jgi:chorismate mutase
LDYVKRGGKKKQIYADRLVTGGVYAHCRNPMYVGNMLVALGMLALVGQPWTLAIGGAFFLFAYVTIVRGEENYLLKRFGDEYRDYCARAPRWLVRVGGLLATLRRYRFDWPAVVVKEYGTLFTTAFITTGVVAWKTARAGALDRFLPFFIAAGVVWVALYVVARWLKKGREMKARGATLIDTEPAKPTLSDLRQRIDEIDAAILELLNQRAAHVSTVFELKRSSGINRVDPQRTESILRRLESLNHGPLSNDDVRRLYSDLLWHFAHEFLRQQEERATPEVQVLARAEAVVEAAP